MVNHWADEGGTVVRGYAEPRLDKHKLKMMVDFCGLHRLPLSVCIQAGKTWSKGGLKAAWAVLGAAAEDEREWREAVG